MQSTVPEDILYLIFQHIGRNDLIQCQKVCRRWLPSARQLFISEIELKVSNVERFLFMMETNQDVNYCNGIKKVIAGEKWSAYSLEWEHDQEPLDRDIFRRLLQYFPRVEEIQVMGSLMPLCNLDADHNFCPQLKRLLLDDYYLIFDTKQECYDLFLTFRNTLEELEIMKATTFDKYGGPLNYICKFPHLKNLTFVRSSQFSNFQALLPLFEHLPQLNTINFQLDTIDEPMFVEKYLQSKPVNERDMLIDRLSKLVTLDVQHFVSSIESVYFISQYLTGVRKLGLTYLLNTQLTEEEIIFFCNKALDLGRRTPKYEIMFQRLQGKKLQAVLSLALQKTFQNDTTNTLHIVPHPRRLHVFKSVKICIQQTTRTIAFINDSSIDDGNSLVETLRKSACRVDTLEFRCFHGEDSYTSITLLLAILNVLPSVTKIVLYYPETFDVTKNEFPQITNVEVEGLNCNVSFTQEFINQFPNLNCLTLNYFGLKDDNFTFELDWKETALKTLHLDLTPFKYSPSHEGFVKIQVLIQNKQCLFKVSLDSQNIARMDLSEQDADIKISLLDLEYLYVYLYNKQMSRYSPNDYLQLYPKDVIVSKLSMK